MKNIFFFNYFLRNELRIFIDKILNKMYIYGIFGVFMFYLPKKFFILDSIKNEYKLLFISLNDLKNVVKLFLYLYNYCFKLFFFRMRVKGLGYKIKQMSMYLFKFFFASNHYFYFHVPNNIYIRRKKREFIIISNNKQKLNDIFYHLLQLKKLDFYEKTKSLIVRNKILFIKKKK